MTSGEYVRREDVPAAGSGEPTGEDGVHKVDPTEHRPTEQTREEREAAEKKVEGGTGAGPVNEDNSEE